MSLIIRAPIYDETVEVEETPTTHVPSPPLPTFGRQLAGSRGPIPEFTDPLLRAAADEIRAALVHPVVATPPPSNILPLAPPVLVRQRAVALSPLADRRIREDDFPIRTLFGEPIPLDGEPLEPFPVATAAPAVRVPPVLPPGGFGFGLAPVIPGWEWANGQPPFEPHDRNNPLNPNRYYIG